MQDPLLARPRQSLARTRSEAIVDDPGYRFFDHTGDSGVDVVGRTEAEAVSRCARAFLDLLTDAPGTVQEREARPVQVAGIDRAATLVALCNELLFLFEVERFLCARFAPSVLEATRLEGTAHGERFDPARHPIARPVKAVTHHGARLARAADGLFHARLIFDL